MFAKIVQDYVRISCWNVAKSLYNLETYQIHQEAVNIKISCPIVLHKEGTWAIDLTWLKKVDVESLMQLRKNHRLYLQL
jgi:hypothetical protein